MAAGFANIFLSLAIFILSVNSQSFTRYNGAYYPREHSPYRPQLSGFPFYQYQYPPVSSLPYYYPYPYYSKPSYPYNPSLPHPQFDPYANIPTEIIDIDVPSSATPATQTETKRESSNIPAAVDTTKNIPQQFTQENSNVKQFNYLTAPKIVKSFVSQSKPIQATITRTFYPSNNKPVVKVLFVNGVEVTEATTTPEIDETTTEERVETTTLDEKPDPIFSWL